MSPVPRRSPSWLQPAVVPRKTVFRVFQEEPRHWRVASSDGMTGGFFIDQKSAVRFARREADGVPVLVLSGAGETPLQRTAR